jgi:hypothetical protein
MLTTPRTCGVSLNSARSVKPGPPLPSPRGQPPCTMKSLITRWKVRPS